jgi:hypothetical protein
VKVVTLIHPIRDREWSSASGGETVQEEESRLGDFLISEEMPDGQSLAEGTANPVFSEQHLDAAINTSERAEKVQVSFKTEIERISRQSGIAFAGTIFTAVVGYAFKIYLARFLGADALGLYALGIHHHRFHGDGKHVGHSPSGSSFCGRVFGLQKNLGVKGAVMEWFLDSSRHQPDICGSSAESGSLDRNSVLPRPAARALSAFLRRRHAHICAQPVLWQCADRL